MNKKASVGTTLTWFVATIIIFFLFLVWFFLIGSMYTVKKTISGDSTIQFKGVSDSSVEREFFLFLNSNIEFEGQRMNVADLIANREIKGNEKYFVKFKEEADNFLGNLYAKSWSSAEGTGSYGDLYKSAFIRIYPSEGKIIQYDDSIYFIYNSDKFNPSLFDLEFCNPTKSSALTQVPISNNKKIAFCLEYKDE